jgi:hypothetical protein
MYCYTIAGQVLLIYYWHKANFSSNGERLSYCMAIINNLNHEKIKHFFIRFGNDCPERMFCYQRHI